MSDTLFIQAGEQEGQGPLGLFPVRQEVRRFGPLKHYELLSWNAAAKNNHHVPSDSYVVVIRLHFWLTHRLAEGSVTPVDQNFRVVVL